MDIIEAIQIQIDKIANEQYKKEEECCTPKFTVALLKNNKIILTCKHRNLSFGEVIFPVEYDEKDMWVYGLCNLEYYMKDLYNRTM